MSLACFQISQIVLSQMGWGLLGNWEICSSSHFPFPNFPNSAKPDGMGLLGNWEFGKWIGRDLFTNRGCVCKHGLGAPVNFPRLSPCLFIKAWCVYKHGFGTRIVTQNVIIIVNANTHTDTTADIV